MFWDSLYSTMELLTGVGIFIVGIILFSQCLEKNASRGMKSLFKKISNNKISGVAIGAGVTMIVQSSSATTVMVIGLLNAGIMTLYQATTIIMGANIGTTITALIVSLSTFKIKYLFMVLIFFGASIKMISKKETVEKICDLMISFGILFVGLEIMSTAFATNQNVKDFFVTIFENVSFPLLLILLSIIFTALLQSSSAAAAIFISMVANNLLPITSALYLVLGANIGTCITAVLASFHANTNAKRAALIHFLFNFLGAIIFLVILWPFESIWISFYQKTIPDPVWQLSIFHVIFNILTTFILIWFIKPLNELACFLIKEKIDEQDILRVSFIDDRLLSTPTIAIEQTIKEINLMAIKTKENLEIAFNALTLQQMENTDKLLKEETKIDFLNRALSQYLIQISATKISIKDEKRVGSYHHVINDLERIGDHAESLLNDAVAMNQNRISLPDSALENLKLLYSKVIELFELSIFIFNSKKINKLKNVTALAKEINLIKEDFISFYIQRLNSGDSKIEDGKYFYDTTMLLERISNHLVNIAFSVTTYTNPDKKELKITK